MFLRYAFLLALLATTSSVALAQGSPAEQACLDRRADQPGDLEGRITACLRVIGDSVLPAEVRSEAHLRRALAYAERAAQSQDKSDIERALADLSEGLRLDPDNRTVQLYVHQTRAWLNFQKGDYALAIADYTSLLHLDPSAAAYGYRGFVYSTQGNHELAIADYTEAIRLEPQAVRNYAQRAWSYLQAGKSAEALEDAHRVIALDPGNAASYATRVAVYRSLGKTSEAVFDLRKALSLDPDNEGIKEELRVTEASQAALGADSKGGANAEKEQLLAEIRNAQERLAALEKADTKVTMAPSPEAGLATRPSAASADPAKLARDLQAALKRVGCLDGEVDGDWGEQSRKALKNFARHAKLSIGSDEPTEGVLDAAAAIKERVCPVVCDDDEKLVDGRCVTKQRKARREPSGEGRREARRYRAEPPTAESKGSGGSSGGLKLCYTGGRGMAICP